MTELQVNAASSGKRLDLFLATALPGHSRSRLQALIRQGHVRRNDAPARPRDLLRTGDRITVHEPEAEPAAARPEAITLDVIYEDKDIIVINKPPGMVVHPGAGNASRTLVNALLHHSSELSGIGGTQRPGIVHRLDKETSGCLVVAKNDRAHQQLSQQFAQRSVDKIYLAIVTGRLRRSSGRIEAPIGRHPVQRKKMSINERTGRAARTDYRVLSAGVAESLVECTLHSGRTHQIRVHLHHLGNPVIGDSVYGSRQSRAASRQMLHAWKLAFTHPASGERVFFTAPLPVDFIEAMKTRSLQLPVARV